MIKSQWRICGPTSCSWSSMRFNYFSGYWNLFILFKRFCDQISICLCFFSNWIRFFVLKTSWSLDTIFIQIFSTFINFKRLLYYIVTWIHIPNTCRSEAWIFIFISNTMQIIHLGNITIPHWIVWRMCITFITLQWFLPIF